MTDPIAPTPSLPSCRDRCMRMTEAGLCDWCASRMRSELADLPGLWAAVSGDLGRGQGVGERVSGSREAPLPVRVDALSWVGPSAPGRPDDPWSGVWPDHRRDQTGAIPLSGMLYGWCLLAVEETPYGPLDLPLPTVAHMAEWLLAQCRWLVAMPWADDLAEEVHQQWRIGRGLAGIRPVRERVFRPCPRCERDAMVRDLDRDRFECVERSGGCGTLWTYDEWLALTGRGEQLGAA